MQRGRAERVEVAGDVHLTRELLRRHVADGAHQRAAVQSAFEIARDAEVDQRHASVPAPDQVGGLQIAVDERRLQAMEMAQDLQHLLDEVQHFVLGVAPLLHLLEQRDALEIAIGEVEPRPGAVLLAKGVDVGGHPRMTQLAERARFAGEGLQRLRVGCAGETQLLEHHPVAVRGFGEKSAPAAGASQGAQDTERASERRRAAVVAASSRERRAADGTIGGQLE